MRIGSMIAIGDQLHIANFRSLVFWAENFTIDTSLESGIEEKSTVKWLLYAPWYGEMLRILVRWKQLQHNNKCHLILVYTILWNSEKCAIQTFKVRHINQSYQLWSSKYSIFSLLKHSLSCSHHVYYWNQFWSKEKKNHPR